MSPQAIISAQFCNPYPVNLNIVVTSSKPTFTYSVNGKNVYQVNMVRNGFRAGPPLPLPSNKSPTRMSCAHLRNSRILLDDAGNPIVTFKKKLITLHNRWKVYRGDSTDKGDFLFSVKKSSFLPFETKLDVKLGVFLENNKKEDVCDFRIEGNWSERSYIIYFGNTSTKIAEMHGQNNLSVTVYPNMDHAFVIALAVILKEINEDQSDGN